MPYTFWFSGILIGESDFEDRCTTPRQHAGAFRPTAYGLEIFPRLTGILSAGRALLAQLDADERSPDTMDAHEIEESFETRSAGRKVVDIGRALSDVEMRAPDGTKLEFESIGFTDLLELRMLVNELDPESNEPADDLPPDVPRYFVSATLREGSDAELLLADAPLGRNN